MNSWVLILTPSTGAGAPTEYERDETWPLVETVETM